MNNIFLILLVLLPLLSAVLGFLLGARIPSAPKWLSVASSIGVFAIALFLGNATTAAISFNIPWLEMGKVKIDAGILYTPLASMMALVVAIVSLAVNIFSLRYMREDAAQPRYWAGISLFSCAMLGLTLANNIVTLFAFWEMVGFGSYLLIGHYGTAKAGLAANKAFIVNRVGDVLFLLGIAFVLCLCGSGDLAAIAGNFGKLGAFGALAAALIFCGVVAKSAQLPLHLWLPDAMEGPTPVSALIHAATMVAAGVYLLCRLDFLFTPILPLIAWVGVITALFSALCAFGQNDIKRVLAYSTISQLGFMVAGFGLGSPSAAFFHLTTHAFFKALLFLAAGAIIDACHHEQDSTKMGGLWKKLPFTFVIFLIGSLALAGFPMTAGFFSKDTILAAAQNHNIVIFALLIFTSLLTALYMGRLIGLVFFGKPRGEGAAHAREGNWAYHAPLMFLAIGALAGGSAAFYPKFASGILAALPHAAENHLLLFWGIFVTLCAAGMAFIYSRSGNAGENEPLKKLGVFYKDLQAGFYFDRIWNSTGEFFVSSVSRGLAFFDDVIFRGFLIQGFGHGMSLAGAVAKISFRKLLTYTLYWIVAGAVILMLFTSRR